MQSNTISSVRVPPLLVHNLCMAHENDDIRDSNALLSGARIKAARAERGWTQEDLAKALGWLSSSRIANYEQGTRRVGIEEAEVLAAVLGHVVPYWMGVITDQEAAVLTALRKTG